MYYSRCSIVICTALLAGCGGSALSPVGSNARMGLPSLKGPLTFPYTGSERSFIVPAGVKRVTIAASGASGSFCVASCYGSGKPGSGGWIKATIPVTSGETLYIFVGGNNGYNGGGTCPAYYCSGGGASDVREGGDGLQNRVVVAGGGGTGGLVGFDGLYGGNGGVGGGRSGTRGTYGTGRDVQGGLGGGPGTPHTGGAGGAGGASSYICKVLSCTHCNGIAGGAGTLGSGGGSGATRCGYPGGGGGGGYYGGGGGGSGGEIGNRWEFSAGGGGGGGGGSSFVERKAFDVKDKRGGAAFGNGQIVISW